MIYLRPLAIFLWVLLGTTAASASSGPQLTGSQADSEPSAPQALRADDSYPKLISFRAIIPSCVEPPCVASTGEVLTFWLQHTGRAFEYLWDWNGDGRTDEITTSRFTHHEQRVTGGNLVSVSFRAAGVPYVQWNRARVFVVAEGPAGSRPSPATGVRAVASERLAVVGWEPAVGATGYRIVVEQSNGEEVVGSLLPATATTGFVRVGRGQTPETVRVRSVNEMGEEESSSVRVRERRSWIDDDFERGLFVPWRAEGTGSVRMTSNAIRGLQSVELCSSGDQTALLRTDELVPNGAVLDLRARFNFDGLAWQRGDKFKILELFDHDLRPVSHLTVEKSAAPQYRVQLVFMGRDGELQRFDLGQTTAYGLELSFLHSLNEVGRFQAQLDAPGHDAESSTYGDAAFTDIAGFRLGIVDGLPDGVEGCITLDEVEVFSPDL